MIGTYVGFATVGIFVYWYIGFENADGHPLITFEQLSNWNKCSEWKDFSLPSFGGYDLAANPCIYFTDGKAKAATLSLTVLVVIEMFNAFNAISDEASLLVQPFYSNLWLILAVTASMTVHSMILYVPFLNPIFGVLPLDLNEWTLVLAFSFPVILIEEGMKIVFRHTTATTHDHKIKKD